MSAARIILDRPDVSPGLPRLLARARGHGVEFGHCLANHLPMALTILDRLGAGQARLEAWFDTYAAANALPAAPSDQGRIDAGNWQDRLGRRELEGDYRGFFLREVRRVGLAEVERRALPVLVPGIAASALHALMRLAYGHLADDPEEVATALGYWACAWLPLRPDDRAGPPTAEPVAFLDELRRSPELCRLEPPTDLLWHWMRAVAAEPAFPDVAARLRPAPDLLPRVAGASLALMAASMTFEAVHAVTSAHWLRLAGPHLPDAPLAIRYVWQAVASVYPKIGMPDLPSAAWLEDQRRLPCPDWPDLRRHAIASDDEHDVSFVFSASEEQAHYGDRLYQVLAARRLGLIA